MNKNIEILNEYLANLQVETNNLYNMHFNIVGESFFGLHRKLQEYYEKTSYFYDLIAERIKMLEGFPITSLNKIEEISTIKSMQSRNYNGKQILEVLENDFGFFVEYTKDLINHMNNSNDFYTSSILSDILAFFTKELWMITSSLK